MRTLTEQRVNWRKKMEALLKIKKAAMEANINLPEIQIQIESVYLELVDEADINMVQESVGCKIKD